MMADSWWWELLGIIGVLFRGLESKTWCCVWARIEEASQTSGAPVRVCLRAEMVFGGESGIIGHREDRGDGDGDGDGKRWCAVYARREEGGGRIGVSRRPGFGVEY